MSEKPSQAASLFMLQAYANYLDQGGLNATFVFYDGARVASIDDAAESANKLVTCTLPKPCFNAVFADYIELKASDAGLIIKSGTAAWCRIYNGQGLPVLDLDVGIVNVPEDVDKEVKLNTVALSSGTTLMLNSIKLRPPL